MLTEYWNSPYVYFSVKVKAKMGYEPKWARPVSSLRDKALFWCCHSKVACSNNKEKDKRARTFAELVVIVVREKKKKRKVEKMAQNPLLGE